MCVSICILFPELCRDCHDAWQRATKLSGITLTWKSFLKPSSTDSSHSSGTNWQLTILVHSICPATNEVYSSFRGRVCCLHSGHIADPEGKPWPSTLLVTPMGAMRPCRTHLSSPSPLSERWTMQNTTFQLQVAGRRSLLCRDLFCSRISHSGLL